MNPGCRSTFPYTAPQHGRFPGSGYDWRSVARNGLRSASTVCRADRSPEHHHPQPCPGGSATSSKDASGALQYLRPAASSKSATWRTSTLTWSGPVHRDRAELPGLQCAAANEDLPPRL